MAVPVSGRRLRRVATVLGLAAAYALSARLGLSLGLPPAQKATSVWPPSGIALGALLIGGPRLWAGVWLGAVAGNMWDYFLAGWDPHSLAAHAAVSAVIATGSTLQALLAAVLLRGAAAGPRLLERVADVVRFLGVVPAACLVASIVGTGGLVLVGFVPWSAAVLTWWTWWVGDVVGILLVTPLLLAWRTSPARLRWEHGVEGIVLAALLGTVGMLVFGEGASRFGAAGAYLTVPLLLWAAFRFGAQGVTLCLVAVAGMAVAGTARGGGPFQGRTVTESLLLLQLFLAVVAVTTLVLASVLAERARLRAGLEQEVAERTSELRGVLEEREVLLQLVTSEASTARRTYLADRVAWHDASEKERTERGRLTERLGAIDIEMVLAQHVNESLLAEDIVRPGVEVVVRQIPCSHLGGDYLYAVLPRPDQLYLCVGDVAGHGISAALVVSRIHSLVQTRIVELCSPERILEDLDRALRQILAHTSLFMTFAVFRVHLAEERIDYATAGHPAQLLLRSDGHVESLTTPNGILGPLHPDVLGAVRSASTTYRPGDTLILFTDGLFEVLGRVDAEILGESGLLPILSNLAEAPPRVVVSEILRGVTDYGRPGPFADDVTLLVARFGPRAEPSRGTGAVVVPTVEPEDVG